MEPAATMSASPVSTLGRESAEVRARRLAAARRRATAPAPVPVTIPRKELIHRLRKRWCELCEQGATVAVHHAARLADLGQAGPGQPAWAALMAEKRRKTLIVCAACHDYIHANPVANAA